MAERFFYRTGANELAVVEVQTSPTFQVGQPQVLFRPFPAGYSDMAPNGKRALLIVNSDTAAESARLEAVVDWFGELRRRAPVSRK
ncbi:MAG: hypothetical protein ACLQU1_33645 [Bryobacteraceae bacterium]